MREKKSELEIFEFFETYEISKLDVNRMYRYLDKYLEDEIIQIGDDCENISVSSV